MVDLSSFPVLTSSSESALNSRQLLDYRLERENCLTWLLTRGKNPQETVGYAEATVKSRAYRMDRFYRFVWEHAGDYTINVTHDHADAWMDHLAERDDAGQSHKRACVKALKMLYKWRHHEHGLADWNPEFSFSREPANQPRDFLTRKERSTVRSAALEYGAVPDYGSVTPAERDRWKVYLAQRFEKPKSKVTQADWDRANSWKIPSLVWTSLDTGLRPIEVERAVVSWVDTDNDVLRIPKEMSSKTREHWVVGVTKRTSNALERWLEERKNYEMYDETQVLWLTRQQNPYTAAALRTLLRRICDDAGIDYEHRSMSWYTIRHSVGTYMTREEDLSAAQTQLRHKSPDTTMKYDQAPVEDRQKALERMG